MIVTAGATNRSVYFYIVGDSSHASPGDPVTGLLFSDIETGGSASYNRQGAARVDLTLITQTVAGAHSDGGFIEVDATNQPGVYRCDYPDAAFATGVDQVICQIVVAAANNAVAAPVLVDIFDIDVRDAVRGGMTALPNAAAEAAGGLYTRGSGAGQINQTASGEVDVNVAAMEAAVITAAKFAAGALDSNALNADAVTDIWAKVVESQGSYTAQQAMSVILSALAGVTSSGGAVLESPDGVATRISATIDGSNNRTAMTLTPSS